MNDILYLFCPGKRRDTWIPHDAAARELRADAQAQYAAENGLTIIEVQRDDIWLTQAEYNERLKLVEVE